MRKTAYVWAALLLCAGLLSGCGADVDADTNTVYVDKNGKVVSIEVEALDEDYYSEAGLEESVNSAVDAYNEENGGNAVTVEELTVSDGVAKLKLKYATTDDYTALRGVELYQGKLVQALAAGYGFDEEFFAAVSDGEVTGEASRAEVISNEDDKVVVIRADGDTDVKVAGKITYVSRGNVTVTGKDTVSIQEGTGIGQTGESVEEAAESTEATVILGEVVTDTESVSGESTETVEPTDTEAVSNAETDAAQEESGYIYIVYR